MAANRGSDVSNFNAGLFILLSPTKVDKGVHEAEVRKLVKKMFDEGGNFLQVLNTFMEAFVEIAAMSISLPLEEGTLQKESAKLSIAIVLDECWKLIQMEEQAEKVISHLKP